MALYDVGRVVVTAFFKIFYRLEINGAENIPEENAKFLICANHKSNLDPPLVGAAMPFQIGFMAKEELFHNKLFGALIRRLGAFPIRRGKSDFGALRTAMSMVKSGRHIVVFPEGGRSKNGKLRRGKMGAAMIAVRSGADILPVGIDGTYRPFSRLTVNIGSPIRLDEYFDVKITSPELQRITDELVMPRLSELSGIPMSALPVPSGSDSHNNSKGDTDGR